MSDENVVRTISQSVDLGCSFFDTAPCYTETREDGSSTINEELVGTALQHYRHNVQIATKFGVTLENRRLILNSAPEQIEIELEQSLRRQKTDYIDLYYQHRIDPKVEPEAVAEVMAKLAKEGKILHWGISENSEEYLRRAHKVFPVTCIQNMYSMLFRNYENLFGV